MTEIMVYNMKDAAAQLGVTEAEAADLVKAGLLELSPGGFITDQAVSNFKVLRRVERDQEAQNAAYDRGIAHAVRLRREHDVFIAVILEALPKLAAEVRRRIEKLGAEPAPAMEKRLEQAAIAETTRRMVRA